MSNATKHPANLKPETAVLTHGFDPSLSVGSARPAVFRSSTYVFSSPEAAERAFDIMGGRAERTPGENVDLVYSRFNHPNAQILEDQIIPLEPGTTAAAVFNSGMAAIMTALLAVLKPGDSIIYTVPIYGGTQTLIQGFLEPFGIQGIPVPGGRSDFARPGDPFGAKFGVVLIETPANPTIVMTDIQRACQTVAGCRGPNGGVRRTAAGHDRQYISRSGVSTPAGAGCRPFSLLGDQISGRLQRHHRRRVRWAKIPR